MGKPRIAVHKFSSCDGCQLAFLNLGETLLELARHVEMVHFAEAGYVDETAPVDIAFVEGSVSTPHELERIEEIRANSKFLIKMPWRPSCPRDWKSARPATAPRCSSKRCCPPIKGCG